ncbi:AAA family ATPase [Luteolibacter sp. Populi]|uniref:AAA family ATPase n=1 Tax=Luteolibacter sp. Populi TaxID=3230487 RepID=UPI003467B6A4
MAARGPQALLAAVGDTEKISGPDGREPFRWDIQSGAESWTSDAALLDSLSDPPIIEGLLREREVGSVVGAAKTAKTWFSLALALAVAKGDDFLGHVTHQRKVLYLDYELKAGTFRKRMSMLCPEGKPDGFFYQILRGERRVPSVDEIAALCESQGFGLVVVDSLYRTGWLAEENSNDTTPRDLTPLQDFTRRVPASLFCVDHTAKGGGNERSAVDAARGASSKGGFWDCLLVLRATDKGPDPAGTYAILEPVLRDWPRMPELPLVSFSWHVGTASVECVGEVGRGETDSTASAILEALADADKPVGRRALVQATKIDDQKLWRALQKLEGNGRVMSATDPNHSQRLVYRLPDCGDDSAKP